jgi:hypothetical protein
MMGDSMGGAWQGTSAEAIEPASGAAALLEARLGLAATLAPPARDAAAPTFEPLDPLLIDDEDDDEDDDFDWGDDDDDDDFDDDLDDDEDDDLDDDEDDDDDFLIDDDDDDEDL